MHKEGAIAALRAMAQLVQKEYSLTQQELQTLVFSETIPATIFREDSTPLEAIISYLGSQGIDAKDIGKRLNRTTNYVNQVLQRGTKHREPEPTPYQIPLSLLAEDSAGKAIASHLAGQGLTTRQIAELLQKDESTVWTWRKRAEGGR